LNSAETSRARSGLDSTTAAEMCTRRRLGRTRLQTPRFPSSCGAGTRPGPQRRRPISRPCRAPGSRAQCTPTVLEITLAPAAPSWAPGR
jgi:hypothetical protein